MNKVVGISDGDMIEVLRAEKAVKVPLDGVDAPRESQTFRGPDDNVKGWQI
jgi:endonuclease YncB( thermonuclease family)